MNKKIFKYFELVFWAASIFTCAIMQPNNNDFSFCLLKFLRFDFCPGCGLAHSMSYLLHGDIGGSLKAHPLGIFAILVICNRIIKLSGKYISKKQSYI